ncbi:MAG TPA: TadE/TadG family type IV pilus assembly protein, partial [Xanthobacteraceae bacterium]|nr:TadE/TadG family type IV pilus assembly protein [Xanthobacteraceae bacterium]
MLFRRFLDHHGGSVLPMFGLMAIPAIGLIGASIDYTRASAARTVLQSAVDATALAMAQNAATTSAANLSNQACTYFLGQIKTSHYFVQPPDTCTNGVATGQGSGTSPSTNNGLAAVPALNVAYSTLSGSQVVVSATSSVPTLFLRIPFFGIQSIPIAANTTAKWGDKRLRVALVLDNTGSMTQGSPISKISALQTASHNLINQLQQASTVPGDIYVSIIPFTKDVNVDPANNAQSWVDWTAWEAEPANLDTANGGAKPSSWAQTGPGSNCPFSNNSDGFKCTDGPASSGAATVSTIASSGTNQGLICPSLDSGTKNPTHASSYYNGCYDSTQYTCRGASCTCTGHSNCTCSGSGSSLTCGTKSGFWEHTWRPAANSAATPAHSTWNGCVTDRPPNYDTLSTAPTSGNTLFPAEQYSVCPVSVISQTYDWTSLNAQIDAMVAAGNTNQVIGLAWGWQSLTTGVPLNAPAQ